MTFIQSNGVFIVFLLENNVLMKIKIKKKGYNYRLFFSLSMRNSSQRSEKKATKRTKGVIKALLVPPGFKTRMTFTLCHQNTKANERSEKKGLTSWIAFNLTNGFK